MCLKTLDTIGNSQRLVFSLDPNQSMKLQDERKKHPCRTMVTRSCVLSDAWFQDQSKSNTWKITSFLENYVTSEGAVSHNVLYYQPLPVTLNQVRFYANNFSEYLPIVSTAFNRIEQNVDLEEMRVTCSL